MKKDIRIAALQAQIHQIRGSQRLLSVAKSVSAQIRESLETQRRRHVVNSGMAPPPKQRSNQRQAVGAPLPSTSSSVPVPDPDPAAAEPKRRSKAPKTPAPQAGRGSRCMVILPPLKRRNRVQLELRATKWELDPRGKTVAEIRNMLYELDEDLREGRRPYQSESL